MSISCQNAENVIGVISSNDFTNTDQIIGSTEKYICLIGKGRE